MEFAREDKIRILLQTADRLFATALDNDEDEDGEHFVESLRLYEAARKLERAK